MAACTWRPTVSGANNWAGCLGGVVTEAEADEAIRAAPPKPKQKRLPRPEAPDALKAWRRLTDTASGYLIRGERGPAIGGVMPAGNRFAAWAHSDPLGEFDAPRQAEIAVLAAHRARRRRS